MFGKGRRTGRKSLGRPPDERGLSRGASGDESAEVRAGSCPRPARLRKQDLLDPLARIASGDPSQMVRLEAQLGVMELQGGS
jgi:hypothetical protein